MSKINQTKINRKEIRERPEKLPGDTIRTTTGCGNLYLIANQDGDGNLTETIGFLGKCGTCKSSWIEGMTRMMTLFLKIGGNPKEILEELKEIKCPRPIWHEGEQIFSCCDAIAKAMEKHLEKLAKKR